LSTHRRRNRTLLNAWFFAALGVAVINFPQAEPGRAEPPVVVVVVVGCAAGGGYINLSLN